MGISLKPIEISNKNEIKSILIEAYDESFPVILWQVLINGKRKYISAFIKEVNDEIIAFSLIQGAKEQIKFDDKFPVFINVTGYFSSFHFSYLPKFSSAVALVVKIPPVIRLSLFNREPKNYYKNESDNIMTYRKKGTSAINQVELMNLSPFKVVFKANSVGLDKLAEGNEIDIISLSEHFIEENQKGIVRSVCYFSPDVRGPIRPSRVSILLTPALGNMKNLPLYKEKPEERFGMEEINLLKKNQQISSTSTDDDTIDLQNKLIIKEENIMSESTIRDLSGYFFGYEPSEQQAILKEISIRDVNTASQIYEHLNYLKKIQFLNLEMKMEIIQSLTVPQVATAMRLSTKDIIRSFITDLPELIQKQVVECLREQKMATSVLRAQKEFVKYVRYKEENGLYKLTA